jgi:hypothetical protein
MVGLMVLVAVNIAADLYLHRVDVSVDDNLLARKQLTQVRVLKGTINTLIIVVTVAAALTTFEQVRQYGVSLFASAGTSSRNASANSDPRCELREKLIAYLARE